MRGLVNNTECLRSFRFSGKILAGECTNPLKKADLKNYLRSVTAKRFKRGTYRI